jgi:hypothetical protein
MASARKPQVIPRLIGEDVAATYIGRSRTAFRMQRQAGQVPAPSDYNGKVPLWDTRVLDAWVDAKSGLGASNDGWADF